MTVDHRKNARFLEDQRPQSQRLIVIKHPARHDDANLAAMRNPFDAEFNKQILRRYSLGDQYIRRTHLMAVVSPNVGDVKVRQKFPLTLWSDLVFGCCPEWRVGQYHRRD